MRHAYFGRKLSRTKNERRSLLRNLSRDLLLHGKIRTTLAKAKAVQPMIEKLITKAKIGTDQKKREAYAELPSKEAIVQLFKRSSGQFTKRTSGYTRITKLGPRKGDSGEEVLIGFVDEDTPAEAPAPAPIPDAKDHKDKKTLPQEKKRKNIKK
ncbi:MAG: 50S ribosomal protein L17 [bacterium]|nr:50S ribosomal protein L17 [bacterium]